MRISVIGCGYLGAVHAASMASLGHDVVGIDTDESKVALLSQGKPPFFEPEFPELLEEAIASGRLRFTTDFAEAKDATVHFICVGTPQKRGEYAADLTYVQASTDSLVPFLDEGDLVVGKSTVPVGTAKKLADKVAPAGALLLWNPEFLRESFAVQDTLHPDRIVYGVPGGPGSEEGERARAILDEVYAALIEEGIPQVITDYPTAELVKVAANSFLATKISFINAVSEVCEASGGDVTQLADAIGYDERIGRKFLGAGLGFGGGCLPKDIRAFMARAGELGADDALTFLREVDAINMRRRDRVLQLTRQLAGGNVMGKRVTVLGAAFKPNSDDVRDSPALSVAGQLSLAGADVSIYDPEAMDNARKVFPTLNYSESLEEALSEADIVVLATEWKQFRELDPVATGELVHERTIIDARNVLPPQEWKDAGWNIQALGRNL